MCLLFYGKNHTDFLTNPISRKVFSSVRSLGPDTPSFLWCIILALGPWNSLTFFFFMTESIEVSSLHQAWLAESVRILHTPAVHLVETLPQLFLFLDPVSTRTALPDWQACSGPSSRSGRSYPVWCCFLNSLLGHSGTREKSTTVPCVFSGLKGADIWPCRSPLTSQTSNLFEPTILWLSFCYFLSVGGKETRSLEESKLGQTSSYPILGGLCSM